MTCCLLLPPRVSRAIPPGQKISAASYGLPFRQQLRRRPRISQRRPPPTERTTYQKFGDSLVDESARRNGPGRQAHKGKPYLIISVDGGGLRGAGAAALIARMEQQMPGLIQRADAFAGTSTGALIAAGLASGMTADAVAQLYATEGKNILKINAKTKLAWLFRSRFTNAHLISVLDKAFGEKELGDLDKPVLIPTFLLDSGPNSKKRSWQPRIFSTLDQGSTQDNHRRVSEVLAASAAAPGFLDPVANHADGGLTANNPTVMAIAAAHKAGVALEDIHVISINPGFRADYLHNKKRGLLSVLPKLGALLDGPAQGNDWTARQMLGEQRYVRISLDASKASVFSPKTVETMIIRAQHTDISQIESLWQQLSKADKTFRRRAQTEFRRRKTQLHPSTVR